MNLPEESANSLEVLKMRSPQPGEGSLASFISRRGAASRLRPERHFAGCRRIAMCMEWRQQ